MLSSIVIALLQATAGDPAAPAATPSAEAPAEAASAAAPRTERRRVCRTYEASTGGRLPMRRCRMEEVSVEPGANGDAPPASTDTATTSAPDEGSGRSGADAAAPASTTP
jgi:hypothetical protein